MWSDAVWRNWRWRSVSGAEMVKRRWVSKDDRMLMLSLQHPPVPSFFMQLSYSCYSHALTID
jgi:hypothetical protein